MHSEIPGGSAASVASVQHALMIRRLQRSRLANALIKSKAQRHVALKALCRSIELRQQLSQAQEAAYSTSSGQDVQPAPTPPLDPSVKALIDKLTEIAELVPLGYSGDHARPSFARPSQQRVLQGPDDMDRQQNHAGSDNREHMLKNMMGGRGSLGSEALLKWPTRLRDLHGGAGKGAGGEGGWGDAEAGRDLDGSSQQGGEGVLEGEEAEGGGSDEVLTPLDTSGMYREDTMSQQMLQLDSNVDSLFEDLEKQSAKAANNEASLNKGGAWDKTTRQAEAEKTRLGNERKKEKAALLAKLELKGSGQFRRPLWRWIAQGVQNPDPDRVLKGKNFWRAAVLLVIVFYVRPKRQLMERKARSKGRDTQDWNTTLTIYFDRCQTWLLKAARVPVGNSVLKNPKLDLRLNRVDTRKDAYGTTVQGGSKVGGGFVSSLIRKVAQGDSRENVALTLMRLKVHTKGVMQGLTQEMPPSDIMTFFSYLAGDGNYFPEGFFFEAEAGALSFDDLGAVRKLAAQADAPDDLEDTLYALHPSGALQVALDADAQRHPDGFLETHHLGWIVHAGPGHGKDSKAGKSENVATTARPTDLRAAVLHGCKDLPGKLRPVYRHEANGRWFDTSLVEMILTNYFMVRVLIPWILLYPQESGLIPASGVKPSLLTQNCQVLASIVYLIMRVLRPELTQPSTENMNAAVAEETERAEKNAAGEGEGDEEGHEGSERDSEKEEDDDGGEDEDEKTSHATKQDDTDTADPKSTTGDAAVTHRGGPNLGVRLRRGIRAAKTSVKPRTVQQIMQQKRYVSVTDKQLLPGLLPDTYFLPFAERLRPWVLQLAAEFDLWMQKVVAEVMGKVEGSIQQRHERTAKSPT